MPVGIAVAAVGAAISITQMVKASNEKKKALAAIDDYKRQEITNPYLGLDKYPMEAIALRQEANDRMLATAASVASRAGRGLSLLPQASNVYSRKTRELSADIEKYQYERDKLIAYGEEKKQAVLENRESQDISGLSSLYSASRDDFNSGMISLGNSIASGASAVEKSNINFGGGTNKSSGSIYSGGGGSLNIDYSNPNTRQALDPEGIQL